MTDQRILDYLSTAIIVLTGIATTGAVSGELSQSALFWCGIALIGAKALEERYKRRVKVEALQTPTRDETDLERELRQAQEELASLEQENQLLRDRQGLAADDTQPVQRYGATQ